MKHINYTPEYIQEIWGNPNWVVDSLTPVGDGWYDAIMHVTHDGVDYWTEASYDGEIHDFGEYALVRTSDKLVIAEHM